MRAQAELSDGDAAHFSLSAAAAPFAIGGEPTGERDRRCG